MKTFYLKVLGAVSAVLILASFSAAAAARPIVTDISAAEGNGKFIAVSWILPETESEVTALLVFRDTQPIASYSQLAGLTPAAVLDSKNTDWEDAVTDYIDYYYAVIAVTGRKRYDIIIPSMNATVNGAHLKLSPKKAAPDVDASASERLYPEGNMRETPLPYIDLIEGMYTAGTDMGKQTREEAKQLAGKSCGQKAEPLDPYIFEEDLISPDGGDDYFLFDVLKTTFIRKKYDDSAAALGKLLGTNRSEGVTRRAKFYLGESYYFSGRYSDAVKTFLTVSDDYSSLSKKWIDSSLDFMTLSAQ
jgi:opacity protein-like surface antigen